MGWGLKYRFDGVPSVLDPDRDGYQFVRSDCDAIAGIRVLSSVLPSSKGFFSVDHIRWGIWGVLC